MKMTMKLVSLAPENVIMEVPDVLQLYATWDAPPTAVTGM